MKDSERQSQEKQRSELAGCLLKKRELARGPARELLRGIYSGRSLTLAEYVYAEEVLAGSSARHSGGMQAEM